MKEGIIVKCTFSLSNYIRIETDKIKSFFFSFLFRYLENLKIICLLFKIIENRQKESYQNSVKIGANSKKHDNFIFLFYLQIVEVGKF